MHEAMRLEKTLVEPFRSCLKQGFGVRRACLFEVSTMTSSGTLIISERQQKATGSRAVSYACRHCDKIAG